MACRHRGRRRHSQPGLHRSQCACLGSVCSVVPRRRTGPNRRAGGTNWRDLFVKERKQAEFLVEESFPWELIERIGVIDEKIAERVASILREAGHRPKIVVAPRWYY